MTEQIRLSERIRKQIKHDLRGSMASWRATRLRILLALDSGLGTTESARQLGCGTATVKRVKARFRKGGYDKVVEDGRSESDRIGRPRALKARQEKELIALACSAPPEGARWTVRLLAKHFDGGVSAATVHRILQRDGIKPWREKNVVRSRNRRGVSHQAP